MDSSRKKPLLTAFSVYTNANRLLTIHPPNKSADEISCVHGIRALSIFWVVLGHRFSVAIMGPTMNTTYVFTKWVQNIGSTYLTGATVSVDTFFVMSGMLLTFIFLKQMRTSTDFKPAMFYLHRFLRLTPALAAVVLFEATLLIRMRDGPLWETNLKALKSTCEKAWWQTLLYIQNYYNPDGICVGQSWYLAVDTQLFWMSPFILLPLWKWPKKTLMAIVTLIFTSVIIIAIISYIDEYPGGIMDPRDPFMLNMKYIYMPTHTRYGPWLVGVLLGYFLHRTKEVRLDMNKYVVGFTWAAVLATLLAVVLGAHPFYKLDGSSTLSQNVAFLSLHRLAWGICIAWIVFACKNGYGGPINWFLSLGFWQPISRLSYSLYLVHMDVQMIIWMATRTNLNFSDADLFIIFASDITLGLAVALVWSLTFESPILILEKQLLGRGGKREAVQTRHVENGYENSVYSNKDQRAIFS
ncbi:nose resistant to fluoxetine protein 6-like [Ctenocephalides felis]|uniref:nose resistant to fluoxetine protein 6-like n=1 Tax=Ctenocephalides felis TaxID=7515 RepID=UPI000E6E383F|nr:nose resistant to fluoxetine protein 6-like [Ctenocephalides felis]